jgi:hypothetical protein
MFALSLIPILGLTAAAVEYAQGSATRQKLNMIADAAVLSAVSSGVIDHSLTWPAQRLRSSQAAEAHFDSMLSTDPQFAGVTISRSVHLARQGHAISARLCFDATRPTPLTRIIGVNSGDLSNCATAATGGVVYASIHFLIDASGSMGIGASTADQVLMNTRLGCAFACHTINWASPPACDTMGWWSQTTDCARQIGATTRFDVVKSAVSRLVQESETLRLVPNQFEFSVHKFSNRLTSVRTPTTNAADVRSAVNTMQMDVAGAGTNFRRAMTDLLPRIPVGGDGSTPANRKVYLVVLTDGVEDNVYEVTTNGHGGLNYHGTWVPDNDFQLNSPGFFNYGVLRTQVINPAVCTPFKTRDVHIMTLNTEYVTPPGGSSPIFPQIANILRPQIQNTMRACVNDPQDARFATSPTEIQAAIDQIFRAILAKARLTT